MDEKMFYNFIVAVSAVIPMFCLMAIGAFVKFQKWLNDEELNHMNHMVFRVLSGRLKLLPRYEEFLATHKKMLTEYVVPKGWC